MLKVAKLERGCNGPMIDQLKPIIRLQKLSESSGLLEDAVASPCPEEECAHDYMASIVDRLVSLDFSLCSVLCLWHTCFPVELTRKRRYLSRTLFLCFSFQSMGKRMEKMEMIDWIAAGQSMLFRKGDQIVWESSERNEVNERNYALFFYWQGIAPACNPRVPRTRGKLIAD